MEKFERRKAFIKGKEGEDKFCRWLDVNNMSYLYVDQTPEKFAPLFKGHVKRPDFLVLFESVGLIAVDVKNYTPSKVYKKGEVSDGFTLRYEDELKQVITFERVFRIPVWYSYMAQENDQDVWYWISALRAIEVGIERDGPDGKFLALKKEYFEIVKNGNDLGKLYTHRLPSVKNTQGYN